MFLRCYQGEIVHATCHLIQKKTTCSSNRRVTIWSYLDGEINDMGAQVLTSSMLPMLH